MQVSDRCISLIKQFEGFRSAPYPDAAGIPTIGYGTTVYPEGKKVTLKDPPISQEKASALLAAHVDIIAQAIQNMILRPLRQPQFDALVSFGYNIGTTALGSSTLIRKVNANPGDPAIKNEFLKWIHAGGKVLEGLKKRRQAEADLYFS